MEPLTIYPKHPTADAYRVGGSYAPYALVAVEKRFSDAELAAEWYAADMSCWVRRARCSNYPGEDVLWDHYQRGVHERATFERFATAEHFDGAA